MQDMKARIITALQGDTTLKSYFGGQNRFYFLVSPPESYEIFPRLTFWEVNNDPFIADDTEQNASIMYQFSVFYKSTTSNVTALLARLDTVLTGIGFVRESAIDLYEEDAQVFHKALRYSIFV